MSMLTNIYSLYRMMGRQSDIEKLHYAAEKTISMLHQSFSKLEKSNCRRFIYSKQPAAQLSRKGILLHYAEYPSEKLLRQSQDHVIITNHKAYRKNHVYLISDCFNAELFTVDHVFTHSHYQILYPMQKMRYLYLPYAEIAEFVEEEYFLRPMSGNKNTLYQRRDAHTQSLTDRLTDLVFNIDVKGGAIHSISTKLTFKGSKEIYVLYDTFSISK